tara:strand:- start:5 stop:523 length:519 start_codon:yes stop_codon:yes gene_type:complete
MNRLLITFFSVLTIVVATEQKPFKHEKNILAVLNEYMSSVDNKDIDAMLNHLTIPIDLHFGSGRVVTVRSDNELKDIFQNWKNSPRSNFYSTVLRTVSVEETGIVNNMLAVADITYDRLDKDGNTIKTERALYHFVKGTGYYAKPLKFIWALSTRWARDWKIYMISNIDAEQ